MNDERSLDELLARSYVPPQLSGKFRAGVRARIRLEKRQRLWEMLPSLVAPGAGVISSGIYAFLVPELAGFALTIGLILGGATYVGQLLFTWLTEEFGEG